MNTAFIEFLEKYYPCDADSFQELAAAAFRLKLDTVGDAESLVSDMEDLEEQMQELHDDDPDNLEQFEELRAEYAVYLLELFAIDAVNTCFWRRGRGEIVQQMKEVLAILDKPENQRALLQEFFDSKYTRRVIRDAFEEKEANKEYR